MQTYNFPPTSRYYGTPLEKLTAPDGQPIPYLARRFIPGSDRFALVRTHLVAEGERADLIAARELGDSEASWRLCDANAAMKSEDLIVLGRRIRISLPEGIPGTPTV